METDDTQLRNTGNTGDIFKHAALVALATHFGALEGRVLYVETHAFRPEADLANPLWNWETSFKPDSADWNLYRELEAPYVAKGRYLCSTGLAYELLRRSKKDAVDFVFCESSPIARALLAQRFKDAIIVPDNRELGNVLAGLKTQYDAVLMHVDPYRCSDISDYLTGWMDASSACLKPDGALAALVFGYKIKKWTPKGIVVEQEGNIYDTVECETFPNGGWPRGGTICPAPLAEYQRGWLYHLAIYSDATTFACLRKAGGQHEENQQTNQLQWPFPTNSCIDPKDRFALKKRVNLGLLRTRFMGRHPVRPFLERLKPDETIRLLVNGKLTKWQKWGTKKIGDLVDHHYRIIEGQKEWEAIEGDEMIKLECVQSEI